MAKIDDSVKKKVPELRFKGFTDEWEERKFADFIDVKSGKDYKHLNSGSIPVYGTGGYMLSVDRALSDTDAIGIGRKGTIDKPYLLKAPFWTVDTLFYAVPKQNIDLQFSLSIFKKINWKKFDESTGVPSLSKTVINSVSVSVPNFEEQQKIGSFFKQLDDTITLHQRKLDLLKEQKKGFLQKMFPKNGAKVPELRFAGFADDWEQRKFTSIVTRVNKSTNSDQLPKIEFEDIVAGEGRLNKDVTNKFDSRKGIEFLPDDILFGKLRPYLKNWIMPSFMGVALGDFWVFRAKNSNPNFVYYLIQSEKYQKAANDTSGTKMPRSDWKKVSDTDFSIPRNLEEQKQIGDFFKLVDDTITLHQRKLDLLKEQKKGFLQKMFV
ncbi:restriction endonuclease subunit S [Enterococcus dongliensis]|uniref:restriction endonuclease subunit S n=1 Tax=Enterococcus dongliensis TaxID=2559925 RepID=UPI00288F7465|nr:restriction endonuclease subunit S [Enterococcus dongliensis]MDT2712533.1 restriction endonuclease subunit S [Enterococcus dongliensis]